MKVRVFACLLLFFTSVATAATKQWWDRDPIFVPKSALSVDTALPPPPLPQSKEDNADFQELLDLQKRRTPKECARAQWEVQVSLETFFGPKYGPLSEAEVKSWNPFFEEVEIDANYFAHEVKRRWKRPRPYVAHSSVQPCVAHEPTDSYPSGHATISRVFAHVLSLIDPKRKDVFEKRADQIAFDRVLSGVHNRTDVEAGQRIGDEVFDVLSKTPRFKKELSTLRAAH